MDIVYAVFNTLLKAGPIVLLPIIITIIGLIFRVKLIKAFRSGLTIAIGFAGIKLVINLLSDNLGPAAKAMVENFGIHLDILDVGWGAIAAVTWSSPIIPLLIFGILITNIILLFFKLTDTLDVDIWNYHHMAIVGIMVYFVTDNVFLGLGAALVMAVISFKLADWTAPVVEKYFEIPGVSLPTMSALSSIIIAVPLNKLIDHIPGINKIDFSAKDAQKYLGFFGEPIFMGLILGCGIGALAKYPLTGIFSLGVNMAAVMVLIPKMTALFMEGLMPISAAAQKLTKEKFKGRKFLIGLDAAIVVGNPTVITAALIVIPLTILMAAVIPGNRVLPFADLAVIPFRVALVVALCNGNLFRSILIGLVCTSAILLAGTATSPVLTSLATSVGIDLAASGGISSFAATSLTVSYLVYTAFISNLWISLPVLIVAIIAIWLYIEKFKAKPTGNATIAQEE
ncbi:PTS system galactitol-specific IIC component [Sporomusaceae bacterium BoRhaA]|uniref:PTS galactitol transporter subunit IIC n=1 Tax=Pelorhabdus rhamnosifermentans TaxID=2772457 RepID=UPI001C060F91|nr:PTS transporter subunit IIC [Pelorhabdus rhamnosifermentans]MBU2700205.1 PTS system galactitol-specific IIC component [Pelorhabdus rhamnosifermentans]